MVNAKLLSFLAFLWFVGILLALMMEGSYLGQEHMDVLNALTGYQAAQLRGAGILAIPQVALGVFTHGIPKIIAWDFAFLVGEWELLRWFLILTLSFPTILLMSILFVNTAMGVLSRFL